MNRIFFTFVVILLFIVPSTVLHSQDARIITFEESLEIALKKSYELKSAEYDLIQSKRRVEAERAALRSNASLELNIPNFVESISQEFNTEEQVYEFYKTKTLKWESNLRINQPIPSNGNFSLNSSIFRMSQLGEVRDYTSKFFLEFSQPLFTPNALARNIRKAELEKERTELQYIDRRMNIIHQRITRSYYNLYKTTVRVTIDSTEVAQREQSYNAALEKFENGEISELELIQLEVDLAQSRNKLLSRRGALLRQKNWFKLSIGLDLEQEFNVVPDIEYKTYKINREKMIEEALNSEPRYQRVLIEREFDRMRIEEVQSWNEFKGSFIANFGFNGNDEEFKRALSNFDKTRKLALKLHVPLWDRGQNEFYTEAAKITYQNQILEVENIRQSLIRGIDDDIMRINEAARRVEMLEKNKLLAEKSFTMALEKFREGKISSRDLTLAQERLSEAKMNHLDAVVSYKINVGRLQEKTLWDFENNRSMKNRLRTLLDKIR